MMAGTHKHYDSEKTKVIIGKLIEKADPTIRPVISAFDCFQNRENNFQKLNKFNVGLLENCAEFLGISLADKDDCKIFVKATLINRIYLGFMALLPAKCGECSVEYTIEHDPEHPPFFNCFRCFKGSHDCERNRGLHQTLSAMNIPSGFVWLCDTCHGIVDPIEPRKQRFRHGSTSGNSTPNGNQTMDSSSNTSKLVLQNVLSSTHNLRNSNPNSDSISSSEIVDSEASSAEVCPRFLKWNCPHGISGKKQIGGKCCSLKHLRVCNQFRMSGSTGRKGCKKGSNCSFFHPEICRAVFDSGSCTKRDCRNFHPRSSRTKGRNNPSDTNRQKPETKVKKPEAKVKKQNSSDFLELRNLVTGMAAKLESLEKKMEQRVQAYPPVTLPPQHPPQSMIYPATAHPQVMPLGVPRLHQPHFPYSHQSYC